jgi:hypothetical protein
MLLFSAVSRMLLWLKPVDVAIGIYSNRFATCEKTATREPAPQALIRWRARGDRGPAGLEVSALEALHCMNR